MLRIGLMALAMVGAVAASSNVQAQNYYAREMLKGVGSPPSGPTCKAFQRSGYPNGSLVPLGTTKDRTQAVGMCNSARVSRGPGSCTWVEVQGYSDSDRVSWSSATTLRAHPNPSLAVWGAVCD